MSIAVREAVESIATPAVCDRIVHRALHMAQELDVPAGGDRLQRFVGRHLRAAVAFVVDDDAADAVVRTLGPPVQMALPLEEITEVRPRTVPPEPDPVSISGDYKRLPPERRITLPVETRPCFFVGPQGERLDSLVRAFGLPVTRIEDAVSLLEAIEANTGTPVLLVIDGIEPSVQPTTVATVAPDLPAGSLVLLWGTSLGLETDLRRLAGSGPRWVRVEETDVATTVLEAAATR
jgi:hypothetical protein